MSHMPRMSTLKNTDISASEAPLRSLATRNDNLLEFILNYRLDVTFSSSKPTKITISKVYYSLLQVGKKVEPLQFQKVAGLEWAVKDIFVPSKSKEQREVFPRLAEKRFLPLTGLKIVFALQWHTDFTSCASAPPQYTHQPACSLASIVINEEAAQGQLFLTSPCNSEVLRITYHYPLLQDGNTGADKSLTHNPLPIFCS